jgi:thymidylate synthase
MNYLDAFTIGDAWLASSRFILQAGAPSRYDGAATLEVANLSLAIAAPDPRDAFIAQHGDPAWLAWMHANFFVPKDVPELGNARSYAARLFNYADTGRDQMRWVVERLRGDPENRSAAITTFAPLSDTSYIPCISLLDFWRPAGALELVVYAHSLDFGKKAYGNLVELAALQCQAAEQLGAPVGQMLIHAKSAHIYEPEWAVMRRLVQEHQPQYPPIG